MVNSKSLMDDELMLAVVKERSSSGVIVKEIPIPTPGKDEVLVKIKTASICGTDINIYDWSDWAQDHAQTPLVIGHEIVGEVLEVNGKSTLKPGDLVSSETHIYCGKCTQCRRGNRHICENMRLFGINRNGGFAQYATIPLKTAWKNNPSLSLESMVIQEPLGNAVHAVTKAGVKGKTVGVFGLGPIGTCAGVIAKKYGASRVFGIEPSWYRRNLAQKMGISEVYPALPQGFSQKADACLEMSGSEAGINAALEAAKIAGKVMVFGIPKNAISIDFGKFVVSKELVIEGVFGRRIWETWEEVGRILKSGVDFSPLITHKFKLEGFEEAIKTIKSGECGKILLQP